MTPQCPTMGLACSTAYKNHKCRCPSCRAWKVARNRDDYLGIKHPRAVQEPSTARQLSPDSLSELRELVRLADIAFREDPSYALDIVEAYSANRR